MWTQSKTWKRSCAGHVGRHQKRKRKRKKKKKGQRRRLIRRADVCGMECVGRYSKEWEVGMNHRLWDIRSARINRRHQLNNYPVVHNYCHGYCAISQSRVYARMLRARPTRLRHRAKSVSRLTWGVHFVSWTLASGCTTCNQSVTNVACICRYNSYSICIAYYCVQTW